MNSTDRQRLFETYKDFAMPAEHPNDPARDKHDPMPRRIAGEPYFPLMARDILTPGFDRLYAIVIERGPDCHAKAHAMLDAVLLLNDARDPRPHKDKEHAWSARAKADECEQWYRLNMMGRAQSGKLKGAPEEKDVAPKARDLPSSEKIFAPGDEIILTAPVHFARPGDPEGPGQIISGSVGTIRDVDVEFRNYLVAFDGYPEQNYLVPFDRCDLVDV